MSDNSKWLRKQLTAFLDSKLNDVVLFEKAGLIRDAAAKRGIDNDEIRLMFRVLHDERSE